MDSLRVNTPITLIVIAILFFSAFRDPDPKPVQKQTMTSICTSLNQVKSTIDIWAKQGYYVKVLECQSVATSITQHAYPYSRADLRGGFILVMEK